MLKRKLTRAQGSSSVTKDGSIDRLIEHKNEQEEPQKLVRISDSEKRIIDVINQSPTLGVVDGIKQLASVDPVIWTMYHRRLKGHPMAFDVSRHLSDAALALKRQEFPREKEFDRYLTVTQQRHRPWQVQPLRDDHPHKAYKKGRQIGISELSLTEAVCFLDQHPNTNLLYCVPEEAEILTRRGWMKWFEVREGDEALALDPHTHRSRWEPVLRVQTFRFKGELSAVGPFHCTDDHRWPVEELQGKGRKRVERKIVLTKNLQSATHKLLRMAPHDGDVVRVPFGAANEPRPYNGLVWCPWMPSGTWYMRYRGKVVFTGNCFPRDKQLETFATTRINPMFAETKRINALLTGVNQVYTKRVGTSHIILRSAWESNLGEGVNADVLVLDEKDRMKPGVEIAFIESMSSSPFAWLREVSTPTLPNRGVDASWIKSDQHHWFVKCTRCGLKQNITHESIKQMINLPLAVTELPEGSFEYVCKKSNCGGVLDRMHGEWVSARPQIRLIRGYHMPQTIAVWFSAVNIMQKKIFYKFQQLWMNYVLGETALGESTMLTERDFDMAEAGHDLVEQRTPRWTLVTVGIDWGHRNWVIVMGHNSNGRSYIINARMFEDDKKEELLSVRQVDEWIEQFQPDLIIADDGYGKDRNAYLLRRYGADRFFACRYNPAEKGSATFTPRWSPASNQVLADRTMALKNLCRLIKDREIGFPSFALEIVQLIASHLKALMPMFEENDDGEIVQTVNSTGDDHFAHALFYCELAMDRLLRSNHFNFDFA